MPKGYKKGMKKRDPSRVPLGSGLADRAKRSIMGRQRGIDDEVRAALGRRRNNQSTDSSQ